MSKKLATPENVIALDRSAEWISDPNRWCARKTRQGDRSCAIGAVARFRPARGSDRVITQHMWDRLCSTTRRLYNVPTIVILNDWDRYGRIPAKHVIEALAAELRSQLP